MTNSVDVLPVQEAKPRRKLGVVWVVLGLVLIAALGVGGFFGYQAYTQNQIKTQEAAALSAAQAAAKADDWATVEAETQKGLSLQPVELMAHQNELKVLRAEAYYKLDKFDQALPELEAALANDPSLTRFLAYRMEIFYKQGDMEAARAAAAEALKADDSLALPYAFQAVEAYDAEKYADALAAAEKALKRDADQPIALRVRGSVYYWQDKHEQAKADIEKALAGDPKDVEALAIQTQLAVDAYDFDGAKAAAEKALAVDDEAPAAQWAQATALMSNFDYTSAKELMDKAIAQDDGRPEFYTWRAYALHLYEQEKEQRKDLEQALTLAPDFAPALMLKQGLNLYYRETDEIEAAALHLTELYPDSNAGAFITASFQMQKHELEKALETIEAIIAKEPERVSGYVLRAKVYMEQHELDKAMADFQKAVELNPRSLDGMLGQVSVLIEQEKYTEAQALVTQVKELAPQRPGGFTAQVALYLAQEDNEKAGYAMEEAHKKDPGSPSAEFYQALLDMANEDRMQAMSAINKVVDAMPKDPDAYVIRAWIYLADENVDKAKADADKALTIDRENMEAYLVLSQIALIKEDFGGAVYNAGKVIEKMPWKSEPYGMQGRGYMGQGKTEKAIESFDKALEIDPDQDTLIFTKAQAYLQDADFDNAKEILNDLRDKTSDMDLVNQIEDQLEFLDTIPPAVDGKRNFESEEGNFRVTYPVNWVPVNKEYDPDQILALSSIDDDNFAILTFVAFENEVPAARARDWVDYFDQRVLRGKNNYKSIRIKSIQADKVSGATLTYEVTMETSSGEKVHLQIKRYVFVSLKKVVIIDLTTAPELFEESEKQADEILATFGFLK